MVVLSLTVGGVVGVLLSAGFLWWEIGRYATPQVPVTVFDERKLLAAYTVGLFVGVPFAVAFVLFAASAANGALPGAALFLALLVGGTEAAQHFVARTAYWGSGPAVPFYLVSFRAGIGGILALAALASYLGGSVRPTALGVGSAALEALALVALEVAGGLLSLRDLRPSSARAGGPLAGALFALVAFFLLGLGPSAGATGALAAPLVVAAGALLAYRGRRGILASVPAPSTAPRPLEGGSRSAYGRTTPLPSQPGENESPPH